jgi:hypothetical protein
VSQASRTHAATVFRLYLALLMGFFPVGVHLRTPLTLDEPSEATVLTFIAGPENTGTL